MLWQVLAAFSCFGLLVTALWLAGKNGSKAAQLEALKAELKKQAEEQARAHRITEKVFSLTEEQAREKLHSIANKTK